MPPAMIHPALRLVGTAPVYCLSIFAAVGQSTGSVVAAEDDAETAMLVQRLVNVRTGLRMMRMSAPASPASKSGVSLLSRSWMRNLIWPARSPRPIRTLPACWVTLWGSPDPTRAEGGATRAVTVRDPVSHGLA
jgi:hypothetical protein